MRQDPLFVLSRFWQTASYAVMAIGLFLLFFLGARAFAQVTDSTQVQGIPRQQIGLPGFGMSPVLSNGLVQLPAMSSTNVPQQRTDTSKSAANEKSDQQMTKHEEAQLLHGVDKEAKGLEKKLPPR